MNGAARADRAAHESARKAGLKLNMAFDAVVELVREVVPDANRGSEHSNQRSRSKLSGVYVPSSREAPGVGRRF